MFSFKSNLSRKLMTCPRCYGKGFVDLHDIKRLGMEEKWGQGYCRYCDGEGKVKMGKTKELNPLDTQIGPGIHESDFID
jgi:DnaJ-class molecular chaperone